MSSRGAADKQEQRLGQWQSVSPQGNSLDKWLEKFPGWKDAMGSAYDTFSQGGNFLSSPVALPRAVGTVASLATGVKERGAW